jgi:phosphatidylserine synthase 2
MGKMIIIRDIKLCFFLSGFFEICELTFRHLLPNFYECWWDHVFYFNKLFLDLFGCNLLGIYLGYLLIN